MVRPFDWLRGAKLTTNGLTSSPRTIFADFTNTLYDCWLYSARTWSGKSAFEYTR